ncbi:MAG TPA: Gfo/Idh/MocA family oxidoreductase [Planctomycetota bacterium]|nr:Gfo/Idh/MocA family oxidoreductase [Planctomycetota bacterium]
MLELPKSGIISPDRAKLPIIPVPWGVIGAGVFTRKCILPAMVRVPHIEIAGIHRRRPVDAADTAEFFGARRAYTSVPALLADKSIEAVFIGTPNASHEADVIATAEAGKKWILCEKPLGVSAAGCRAMAAACKKHGTALFVAHCFRFKDATQKVRALIASGALGDIQELTGHYAYPCQKTPDEWRYNAGLSGGGPIQDMGVHLIDLFHYITGAKTVAAQAVLSPLLDVTAGTVEESARILLELDRGITAFIGTSFKEPFHCGYTVIGTKGKVTVEGCLGQWDMQRDRLVHFDGTDRHELDIAPVSIYEEELREMTFHLRGNGPCRLATIDEGVYNQAVVDAIYTAARSGRRTPVQA